MAKITFLSLVFPPDSVSTAQIMGELAIELKKYGHDVNVITTTPHYNRDLKAETKQPISNFFGKLIQKSDYHGIPVYHILMLKKGPNVLVRLLAWLNFHFLNTIASIKLLKNPDMLIVPSPPLTMGINAYLFSLIHKCNFIYNVQEIYPDYAIKLGVIKNQPIIAILYALEKFVYKKSKALTVIAPNMAKVILKKGVSASKVHLISNFVDTGELFPQPKKNDFSKKNNLTDKFVVSYAGNMGTGQDLETFIECADILRQNQNIHFLMLGDGVLSGRLKNKVKELSLNNFTFLDYQPYSLMPQIYASSDLSLVPQLKEITDAAIPSKVYRIMACGRTVLALTKPESDLANLIKEAHCGYIVNAGSPDDLSKTILAAEKNRGQVNSMGLSGRKYVEERYSRDHIAEQYHHLILSLTIK
ncbi:glycosyltransferase family 4 protein [Desulfosarcina ovata]|uniref:Glycosyltransferase WbuB n=1 Tax=Desulfosarcina ovata subsp. ovata TaxID=2752305 RepID=A0A5K8A4Y7_9BACT|nr:glycosyltransferase family 4 protein [Desulfosarcina ovata]BBO87643.1 glycosyltransferase WbuB [Desulfosarcina ovata subsp. ovata]